MLTPFLMPGLDPHSTALHSTGCSTLTWLTPAATYLGIKSNICYNRAKLALAAFWNVGQAANAHGQPASQEDLMEAGAVCSICQVEPNS